MKDIKENYISHVLCNLGSIFMIHNEHFIKNIWNVSILFIYVVNKKIVLNHLCYANLKYLENKRMIFSIH